MQGCAELCPLEASGLRKFQSSFVGDLEWVCRTIRPGEFKTKANLKAAFVQTTQLDKGHLSAWRLDDVAALPSLSARLKDKMGTEPDNMLAVPAGRLREIMVDDKRALCVINDTRTSLTGDHDIEHIALSPCGRFDNLSSEDREEQISQLKSEIIRVFRGLGTPLHPPVS